jgi:hypothetical protein
MMGRCGGDRTVRLPVWRGAGMMVGVLVEVPVMLSVVQIVRRAQPWDLAA